MTAARIERNRTVMAQSAVSFSKPVEVSNLEPAPSLDDPNQQENLHD